MHFFCEAHSSQWRSDGFNQCNYCEPPQETVVPDRHTLELP